MSKLKFLALTGMLLALFSVAGGAETPPAAHSFTYANPIQFMGKSESDKLRDPAIIRENDRYYMVFSVHPFTHSSWRNPQRPDYNSSPGIKLYSSTNLTDWKFENWVVKSSELPETCPYKHRFWAPEIHKINGRFYVIFTADNWIADTNNPTGKIGNYSAFVGVADRIEGPYKHITYIKDSRCDTTLFGDDDGRVYAFLPESKRMLAQEIDLSAIDQDRVTFKGKRELIFTCENADIGQKDFNYIEGPWAIKRNGRYYLFYAANCPIDGSPDPKAFEYWTGVAYGDSPMGPWKKDPKGKIFLGGHLAVFDGPDGRNWFSYRGEGKDFADGFLCIDPFDLNAAGRVQCHPPTLGPTVVPLKHEPKTTFSK